MDASRLRVVGWGRWALSREEQRHQEASAQGMRLIEIADDLDRESVVKLDPMGRATEKLQQLHEDLVAALQRRPDAPAATDEGLSGSQSQLRSKR